MKFIPYPYQQHAKDHLVKHPYCGLLLEMGLGKTVIVLTGIEELLNKFMDISRVLVIAPLKVAENVWEQEVQKWDHIKHLKVSKILGSESQRKKALMAKADIYVINCDNVAWLISYFMGHWPFDMVVVDEFTKFKSPDSRRFKALKMVRPQISRVVILSGSPVPNGLLDLWAPMYLLDRGQRLGDKLEGFRTRYFTKNPNGFGYTILKETENPLIGEDYYERKIYDRISDICISMKSDDWLDLPPRIERNIDISFSPKLKNLYNQFERDAVLALEDADNITAVNSAVLSNKLLQFASGAIYDAEKNWHEIHRLKIEVLEEILDVANGKPVLVGYSYRHELERIKRYLKHFNPVELKGPKDFLAWNDGSIRCGLIHPASASHGLNLQAGGHIATWFGPIWNLEFYQQFNKRLHRPGQTETVIINRIVLKGTIDEAAVERTDLKAAGQDALMNYVKALVRKHKSARAA